MRPHRLACLVYEMNHLRAQSHVIHAEEAIFGLCDEKKSKHNPILIPHYIHTMLYTHVYNSEF